MAKNVVALKPYAASEGYCDRDRIARVLEAAHARDFTEVLVIGYRHGAPGRVEGLYSMPSCELLRAMMAEFNGDIRMREYPDLIVDETLP